MSISLLQLKQLKAVRMLRAGSTPDQVGEALRLQPDKVRAWESACRNLPDDVLARLEHVVGDNEKLRRLIAGLGHAAQRRSETAPVDSE